MSSTRCLVRIIAVLAIGFAGLITGRAQLEYAEGLYGWYEAGPSLVPTAKLRNFPDDEPIDDSEVEFDPGFHFGIAIGRELTRYLRVEVESGFNYNALRSISDADSSSGNFYRIPIMANLALQYPNRTGLVPIIGAGVGGQWLAFDAQNVSLGFTTLDDQAETWTFSYQAYGGVRYDFRANMSVGIFYHYNVADGPSWDFDSTAGNFKLDSLRTHSVSLTLEWLF